MLKNFLYQSIFFLKIVRFNWYLPLVNKTLNTIKIQKGIIACFNLKTYPLIILIQICC